jgi:hypothetical protein
MSAVARVNVQQYEKDPFSMLMERDPIITDPKARDAALGELVAVHEASRRREDARLGRAFIRDAGEIEALAKLSRYETGLERSLYRTFGELRRLQAARRQGNLAGGGAGASDNAGTDSGGVGNTRTPCVRLEKRPLAG